MVQGMDTKKSCGIWFGWNILCLKQRIWFASSLSIQFHKTLVCWIQFDWRDVHKWFRLSLCQVHGRHWDGRFCAQELYCGHVAVVEFRQSRHGIVCGDMLWEMVTKWLTFSGINAAVRIGSTLAVSDPSLLFFVQPCRSLFLSQAWLCRLSVQTQFSLAPGAGLPKGLGMFGATSWVLSELSAYMYASSHRALHMKTMWCSLCRKWKVKRSSTSHMKAVWWMVSWSSVLLCFALQLRFGRLETMCGKSACEPSNPKPATVAPATPPHSCYGWWEHWALTAFGLGELDVAGSILGT